jgi:hypothetical protein
MVGVVRSKINSLLLYAVKCSSVKNNSVKHTGKGVGSAKSRKMSNTDELLPAKKLKRIVVFPDSKE